MTADKIDSILTVVRACDSVILATCDGDAPDARHVTNAMNLSADSLNLYFMTGRKTPKFAQLSHNAQCCLYYFDAATRHAVRLYGKIEFVDDACTRRAHWRDEYSKFGYAGPDSPDFILMRCVPRSYKYYIGQELIAGTL